jgi:hypothetical protein
MVGGSVYLRICGILVVAFASSMPLAAGSITTSCSRSGRSPARFDLATGLVDARHHREEECHGNHQRSGT